MRLLAFIAILAAFAAHGADVGMAKFGDLGLDDNVVMDIDLSDVSLDETDPTVPMWAKDPQPPLPPNYTTVSNKAMTALQSFTETDPTVSSWAKAATKPSYAWNEIASKPTFATVASSGSYNDLSNKPTIPTVPTNVSAFNNDAGYLTSYAEIDPNVPAWAKAASKPTYTASDVGAPTLGMFNTFSNLAATADGKATTAIAYLQGDDAKVVITNYDSAVTMPSLSFQQRIDEDGSNYWKIVWNELTRWNRFTGDGFDWAAWCGFGCFRTNILAQLDQKADRAWGFYDSHTGNYTPDGYTWISSPKIAVAAGLAYQRTVTSEGAIWVLVSNGLVTETGGNMTNGFFRVSDDEGNSLFEIVKGNKRTVGAQAGSLTTTSVMGITHMHITYAVVSESHPTVAVCTDLSDADWMDETSGDCVANVSWTGSSGAWVAEVWGKAAQTAMFVKAEYEIGGETYIRNSAPISAEGGILCTDGIHKVRPVWNNGSITWEVVP